MQTITYTLSLSGISPTDVQDGGVQGDHCKTALVFCPDEALWADISSDVPQNHNIRCRVDASDGVGGYHPSALLTPDPSTHAVTYPLERNITQAGGVAKLFLILSEVDENSREVRCLYSFPASLRFADSPAGGAVESIAEWEINGALDAVLKALAVLEDCLPVETENIADGSITTAKLADGAVAGNKIAERTIGGYQIGYGAITTENVSGLLCKYLDNENLDDAASGIYVTPSGVLSFVYSLNGSGQAQVKIDTDGVSYRSRSIPGTPWGQWEILAGDIPDGSITADKLAEEYLPYGDDQTDPDTLETPGLYSIGANKYLVIPHSDSRYTLFQIRITTSNTQPIAFAYRHNDNWSSGDSYWSAWQDLSGVPDASTTQAGKVMLNNTLTSTSTTEALTAAQGKALKDMIDDLPSGSGDGGLPFSSQYNFNIDEITEDCIRVVGGTTTGTKPPCNNYALVFSFYPRGASGYTDGNFLQQMALSDNGKLYTRYNYSTPANWSTWQTGSN